MIKRRRRGFGQLADVPLSGLGLPARRVRELRLRTAWRRVAGPAVADRAPVIAVRRGVLEIRRPDERWLATLEPLLPELAARLAANEPGLGIERFRVRAEGERGAPAQEISRDPAPPVEPTIKKRPAKRRDAGDESPTLERVRRLYLERVEADDS